MWSGHEILHLDQNMWTGLGGPAVLVVVVIKVVAVGVAIASAVVLLRFSCSSLSYQRFCGRPGGVKGEARLGWGWVRWGGWWEALSQSVIQSLTRVILAPGWLSPCSWELPGSSAACWATYVTLWACSFTLNIAAAAAAMAASHKLRPRRSTSFRVNLELIKIVISFSGIQWKLFPLNEK